MENMTSLRNKAMIITASTMTGNGANIKSISGIHAFKVLTKHSNQYTVCVTAINTIIQ